MAQNISLDGMENSLNVDCDVCNGAGWVHPLVNGKADYSSVIPCVCQKEALRRQRHETLLKNCNFPPFAQKMTLDTFEVYHEVKTAYQEAKEMARHPGGLCWLGLLGGNGTGKTHLGIAICKAWVDNGVPARYALTSLLLDELREGFRKAADSSYASQFNYYCNIPLLMLDDCGIQSTTPWVQEKLDTLVDYRLMNNLSIIITSNQSLDEMSPRLRSRVMRHPKGKIVAIMAEDYCLRGKR